MEPIATITAATIANLAFSEFIKSGAGELAKRSISGAIEPVVTLRDRILAKFRGNDRAVAAVAEVEQQGSEAALTKVTKYLDLEMEEDEAFATAVRQQAQQIINIQAQRADQRQYINHGRDQINIETIHGNPTIGGS